MENIPVFEIPEDTPQVMISIGEDWYMELLERSLLLDFIISVAGDPRPDMLKDTVCHIENFLREKKEDRQGSDGGLYNA